MLFQQQNKPTLANTGLHLHLVRQPLGFLAKYSAENPRKPNTLMCLNLPTKATTLNGR